VTEKAQPDGEGIIKYWNTLSNIPAISATYTFSPTQHNGSMTEEIVMSEAAPQERHLRAGAGLTHKATAEMHRQCCSIIASGLAAGAIYALVGVTSNHVLDLAGDEFYRGDSLP